MCIRNKSDDAKQKEEGGGGREPGDISTPLQNWAAHIEKNTCTKILYRPGWKSKEIIWANHHLTSLELEHLKCLPFISLFLTDLQSARGSVQDF